MATTTNYSWTTPDDTDLVKDGAAAIRTLGSSADTTVKALNPGTTAGDVDYYTTSTAKARLGIGTAGQLLTVNSGATAPEWANAPSSIPANVAATVATSQTTTSNSYTDLATVGPEVTLTTGTKALVIITCALSNGGASNQRAFMSYAVSGATTIAASDASAVINVNGQTAPTQVRASAAAIVTLTSGSNVFTAKYKSESSNTSTFLNREINVINLA